MLGHALTWSSGLIYRKRGLGTRWLEVLDLTWEHRNLTVKSPMVLETNPEWEQRAAWKSGIWNADCKGEESSSNKVNAVWDFSCLWVDNEAQILSVPARCREEPCGALVSCVPPTLLPLRLSPSLLKSLQTSIMTSRALGRAEWEKRAMPQAASGGSPTRASSLEIHLCPLSAQRIVTHGDNNVEGQIFMVYKHLYSLDLQGWLRRKMTLSSRCAMTKEALADGIHPFTAVEANSDHFRLLLSEI